MLSVEFLRALARRGRVEIILTLKSYPERDFSINELARNSRIPPMTTWRAVKDLKKLGLIKTRKIGNVTSVRMTDDREKIRTLRLIPETDPQSMAARKYASRLGENAWALECRLFGSIARGEHAPGEEVDLAVVYDGDAISEGDARTAASALANSILAETNISVVPLCVAKKDMERKGGLASELRDKETIWRR